MKKKYIIFETSVGDGGHHLEYLHHYYLKACEIRDKEFVFVVPELFLETKKRFEWADADNNITFDYISNDDYSIIEKKSGYKRSYYVSKLINKYVRKHKATNVFLSTLLPYVLFLPFILPAYTKLSGILYKVYLYEWSTMGMLHKIAHIILNIFLSKCKTLDKVFILNDNSAVCFLNKKYHTSKFQYTPDPIVNFPVCKINIRKEYNIPPNAIVYLQCGMQTRRKMSIDILKSISLLENKNNLFFVFAGRIKEEIRDEFYKIYKSISSNNILVIDKHLSYDEMSSLLDTANYVFVLYENSAQSSGFIGHAAYHKKPVLAVSSGMIGKLVRKYRLGVMIEDYTPSTIASQIVYTSTHSFVVPTKYIETHQVQHFTEYLFL